MELGGENRREPGSYNAPIDYNRVADIYDLYVTSDIDIGFYLEKATKVQGKVLELMCGTGRVSIPLLEAGVDLTCVDASAGMLARLEERLRARKLKARVVRTCANSTLARRSSLNWCLSPSTRSPNSSRRATGTLC